MSQQNRSPANRGDVNICDLQLLERYLDLAGEEQAGETPQFDALEQHLDHCQFCRQSLERLAAAPDYWLAAAESLDTRADFMFETSASRSQLASQFDPGPDLRHWLSPTETAGAMGRVEHYDVLGVLGIGGMGLVLRAFDTSLQRTVAIKTLRPELATQAMAQERFIREARLAASLSDSHIIPILHVGVWSKRPYVVMPLIEQGSLVELVNQRVEQQPANRSGSHAFTIEEILSVARQVSLGLAAAHAREMVHRDLKPSNILLLNGLDQVVLADFGLARALNEEGMTLSGALHGTPQFMSPEQASGLAVDTRSDLFSLGSLLYWLATGVSPFATENQFATLLKITQVDYAPASQLRADLPVWFDQLVALMLVKQPQDRRVNAEQLAKLFAQLLEEKDGVFRFGKAAFAETFAERKAIVYRLFLTWLLVLFPLVAAVAGIWWWSGSREVGDWKVSDRGAAADSSAVVTAAEDLAQPEPELLPPREPDAQLRQGPLDALDRLSLLADLKLSERLVYWLERLGKLSAGEVPPEAIPWLEQLAKTGEDDVRVLATRILEKNPFEIETAPENPFVPVDF
ncbi:protein kinase domain-containing protein [Planctomycetaceae bacterium SH139]